MRTLNGQPITDEVLKAHAGAMFDALKRIADAGETAHPDYRNSQKLVSLAREALAPCHFFSFEVPACGVANTDPEDMSSEAFEAWLVASCDRDDALRNTWRLRRWLRNRAKEYIAGLRNDSKRRYAAEWLAWRTGKREEAPRASTITAAQAESARLEIDACLTEPPPKGPHLEQTTLLPDSPFTQTALAF